MSPAGEGPLPNFIMIGAMKSGTTSLYKYLQSHPQIFMPHLKEPNFFVEQLNWSRGWDWYRSVFKQAGSGAVAIGEASTNYSKFPLYPGVPGRIAAHLPDVKLIYCIRHPIDRMQSEYRHEVGTSKEKLPVEKAMLENPEYLDNSRYGFQIEQYLEYFPREQMMIVDSRRLKNDRAATVSGVYRFLGVDSDWNPPNLSEEFNKIQEHVAYTPGTAKIRGALIALASRIPRFMALRPVFQPVKRLLARPITKKVDFDSTAITQQLRAELEARLKPDVYALRAYMDEDFDGWGLA